MPNTEIARYVEGLLESGRNAKEKYGENSPEYVKTVLRSLVGNHQVQAVYEKLIPDAIERNDFAALRSIFYHNAKVQLLPLHADGYDHCGTLWPLLDLLACSKFDDVYRILPEGLPLSANGYAMYVHGTNVLLCLLYHAGENAPYAQDQVVTKAEKFAASKKAQWERAVVSCLLAVLEHDVSRFSENLQNVCDGYGKLSIAPFMKMQCQNAYGLLALARRFWPEEEFAAITLPERKNFSKGYVEWLFAQKELSDDLCVTYEAPLEKVNDFLKKPVAVTRVWQKHLHSENPYLTSSQKKAWYVDHEKMWNEFWSH